MKILLVSMPWASLHRPSLAMGVLTACTSRCQHSHQVAQMYANIRWADYLMKETNNKLNPTEYSRIADGYFFGAGEWIFTSALYDTAEWKRQEFCEFGERHGLNVEALVTMHTLAPRFVQELAEEIAASDYDVIGFTSSFLQNVPSLSVARKIKQLAPEKLIVFGGANCDGVQGITLHRNFPFVDIVVCGEGEEVFVTLLDTLETGGPLGAIGGLCWREQGGLQIVNVKSTAPVSMENAVMPEYSSYFEALDGSLSARWLEPELIVEASRGCWWGAKHQCTFCGLNGSFINYRSKSPEVFFEELKQIVTRYRVLDIGMADNILDMKYFKTLLPLLAAQDWDLRMFVEIKANLTTEQVQMLRAAGVVNVQPGIESLSTKVLGLMNKGVTGVQNARLLRACTSAGITVHWNYLFGFPGETDDDYIPIIKQMPALVHLHPPGSSSRITLERFSPYFNNASLGLNNLGPAKIYDFIYTLPKEELADMVYIFESPQCGIKGAAQDELLKGIQQWKTRFEGSTLDYRVLDKHLVIYDRRKGWEQRDYELEFGGQAETYLILMNGYKVETLQSQLHGLHGLNIDLRTLCRWLDDWIEQGLLFLDDDRYIALATDRGTLPKIKAISQEVLVS